jgi:hypothetical protein
MKKDLIVMFLLGLCTLLFIYIPQFSACYRHYVGEINELEYYLSPSYSFFLPFPFPFPFFILFLFFTLLYTNYH